MCEAVEYGFFDFHCSKGTLFFGVRHRSWT
jgi:hypothetical protein